MEQAYITPKKKKEEADKSQENEHGQGNAQPGAEEDSKNNSLETIMVDSSVDTSASLEGVTVEEVWHVKEGEEFGVDRPVLFHPPASPPVSSSTPSKGQDDQPESGEYYENIPDKKEASWKMTPSPPQYPPQ